MQDQPKQKKVTLPPIPKKRYFTIGEASELCAVKPHVLRYWEQEFSQLTPCKRRGNRRYYQYKDVEMIRKIRELLYDKGFTIVGARKHLTLQRRNANQNHSLPNQQLTKIIQELEETLGILAN